MNNVFTVEIDTSCSCCGEADPEVRVFATEALAQAYADVEGGKVRTHEVEEMLPPIHQWVRLSVVFTDGIPGPLTESFTQTYEAFDCTGTWTPKDNSEMYEADGDAWRGVHTSGNYTSVESWTPDTPDAREWHAAKVNEVTRNFDVMKG